MVPVRAFALQLPLDWICHPRIDEAQLGGADGSAEGRFHGERSRAGRLEPIPEFSAGRVQVVEPEVADEARRGILHRYLGQAGPVTLEEIQAARKVWPDEENGALIIVQVADELDAMKEDIKDSDLPLLSEGEFPRLESPARPSRPLAREWALVGATCPDLPLR